MPKIMIKPATEKDADALKSVATRAFEGEFVEFGHYPPGIDSLEYHLNQIKKGDYFKIEKESTLVGGIILQPRSVAQMRIEYFFIKPDCQNEKIGSTVLGLIEDHYSNILKWSLNTPSTEFRNHHFYEKLGYVKTGEFSPAPGGNFLLFKYEKSFR